MTTHILKNLIVVCGKKAGDRPSFDTYKIVQSGVTVPLKKVWLGRLSLGMGSRQDPGNSAARPVQVKSSHGKDRWRCPHGRIQRQSGQP